jgi:hypothetical protein
MVTLICTTEECANENIVYNFFGNPEFVECGGCKAILDPKDLRDDPIEESTSIPK